MTIKFLLTYLDTPIYNQGMGAPDQTPQSIQAGTPLSYRAQLVQRAFGRVPTTAEGLPVGFYRVDLLPTNAKPANEEVQALRNAYSDISFEHGYPTLGDGRPFWHKLEFEPSFAYGCFQKYLESLNEGPRELTQLAQDEELLRVAGQMFPGEEQISSTALNRLLYEYSILYYWRPRSKAHDLYKEAAFRHLRLRRQMSVEDEHYTLATDLLKNLRERVLDTPGFWKDMPQKTAVDMLVRLMAAQRVSVGLPAAGPLSQKETPENVSFEMILRQLGAQANGTNGQTYDQAGRQVAGRELLNNMLSDPTAASQMQELIIRVTKQAHQQLPNPNEGAKARTFKGRTRSTEILNDQDLMPYDVSGAPGENLDSLNEPEDKLRGDEDAGTSSS